MILLASQSSDARRKHLPMSEYINAAELIVIGKVSKPKFGVLNVQVEKVLKGKASFKKQTINLEKPGGKITVTSGMPVIHMGDDVAVLFEPEWQESELNHWPVIETYKDERVNSLKKLIKLLKIQSEKRRIKKLIKWFPNAEYAVKEQLFVELKNMEKPGSFSLFYPAFEQMKTEDELYDLMSLVEESNDPRAVPFFIAALDSSSKDVRSDAAHALYYSYPGFPGVAEAFKKHWDDEGIRYYTQPYLAARFPDSKYEVIKKASTPWLEAKAYEKAGNHKAARKIYLDYLKSAKDISSKLRYAKLLINGIDDEEKQTIYEHIFKEAPVFGVSDGGRAIELMKLINEVDWTTEQVSQTLLNILDIEFYEEAVYPNLALTIERFDGSLRKKAVEKIKAKIQNKQHELQPYLMLAYLASSLEYAQPTEVFPTYRKTHWMKASTIKEIKASNDPVKEYIEMINLIGTSYSIGWPDWLLVHLAAYDDLRVIPALVSFWESHQYYAMNDLVSGILVDSKDERLNQLLLNMLPKATESWAIYSVTQLIIKRMNEQALPYVRQIIKGDLIGDKGLATSALGRLGVEDDIKWFKAYCDYDNEGVNLKSSRACDALAALRKKHNHDINGPIIKSDKMTPLD